MKVSEDLSWIGQDETAQLSALKHKLLLEGKQVIDLSMINPDLAPPRLLQDRLVEACVKPSNHRYSVSRGVRKLREAFRQKYKGTFGVELDVESQICVTMGTKDAMTKILRCFARGSRVLLVSPTYPMHLAAVKLQRFEYDFVPLSRDPRVFLSRLGKKLGASKYDLLVLNFPHNPTGICVDTDFYSELISVCREHGVFLLNDFVYGELTVGGSPAASMLSGESSFEGLIEIYSLSKVLSIPGWRIAAVAGDEHIISPLCKLKQHADYGIFLPLQFAVSGILPESAQYAKQVAREYAARAALLVDGLVRIGWEVTSPAAGASAWAKIPEEFQHNNSLDYCLALLRDEKVALLPGRAFGKNFDRFVRFSLVRPEYELREVLARLERFQNTAVKAEYDVTESAADHVG